MLWYVSYRITQPYGVWGWEQNNNTVFPPCNGISQVLQVEDLRSAGPRTCLKTMDLFENHGPVWESEDPCIYNFWNQLHSKWPLLVNLNKQTFAFGANPPPPSPKLDPNSVLSAMSPAVLPLQPSCHERHLYALRSQNYLLVKFYLSWMNFCLFSESPLRPAAHSGKS